MRLQFAILKRLHAAALLALSAGCTGGGPSFDFDSPEGRAYVYRHAVMEVAYAKSRVLAAMAREEIALDEAAFIRLPARESGR